MDESIFVRLAADTLTHLDVELMEIDGVDVDHEGDVVSLEFEDGSVYVVNSHRAARQIWLSAERAAAHYSYESEEKKWRSARTGTELFADLSELLTRKLGHSVSLSDKVGEG